MNSLPKPSPENPQDIPAIPTELQAPPSQVRAWDRTDDRPSKFGILWRVDGKDRKMFFKTAKARDTKQAELERASKRWAVDLVPTRDDLKDWIAFRRATAGTRWQDVVAGWRESGQFVCTTLVSTAVEDFIAAQEKRADVGTITEDTVRHQRTDMLRFSDAFGSLILAEPDGEAIEDWLDDLGFESNATFNSKLKVVRKFYAVQVEKGLVKANPALKVERRDGSIGEVKINTVAEVAKLFAYALEHHKEALGRLTMEAFVGLRFSSAYRLEKGDINFEDKGILLPRHKLKTRRRRYIDGLPENVWPWLKETNDACWAMTSTEWMHLKSQLFNDAKVPHPHNSLRHSFCTHHMAGLKDPGKTATILCHTSQEELWEHYNGCATEQAGRLYFTIAPLTATAMAKDPAVLGLTYPLREKPKA